MADIDIKQKVEYLLQEKSATIDVQKKEHVPDDSVTLNLKGQYLMIVDDLTRIVGRLNIKARFSTFGKLETVQIWEASTNELKCAEHMFENWTTLKRWKSQLPNFIDGYGMFAGCTSLESWDIPLPKLLYGGDMFNGCTSLSLFDVQELPELEGIQAMFYKTKIKSWLIPLPKAQSSPNWAACGTFQECKLLEIFNGDLPSLTDGTKMFYNCTSLTSYRGALPALTVGTNMFYKCKLDLASVQNIAEGINDLAAQSKTGSITIGIAADLQGNADITAAIAAITAKGWAVTDQYN